jgi:hypothetical protein
MSDQRTHIPADEASSGEKSGRMRVVLVLSTGLAILALAIVLWVFV